MKNRRTNINERELTRTIRRILKEETVSTTPDVTQVIACINEKMGVKISSKECIEGIIKAMDLIKGGETNPFVIGAQLSPCLSVISGDPMKVLQLPQIIITCMGK